MDNPTFCITLGAVKAEIERRIADLQKASDGIDALIELYKRPEVNQVATPEAAKPRTPAKPRLVTQGDDGTPAILPAHPRSPQHARDAVTMQQWRARHGLTQALAATYLDCTPGTISGIEAGRVSIGERRADMERMDREGMKA